MSDASAHAATLDPQFGSATPGKIGMWIFLASDGLSFAGLLTGYTMLRTRTPTWPDPLNVLGIGLTAFATFILICSSLSMVMALEGAEQGNRKKTLQFLGLTILGGLLFLGIQAYEFTHLVHEQHMYFSHWANGVDNFASTFFLITGFHGAHVTTGVIYLSVMFIRTAMGHFDGGKSGPIELCGLFWHFVDLVWILVFTLIYLM